MPHLVVCDLNAAVVSAYAAAFLGMARVQQGPFDYVAADAIISPGNSFGFMDGGFDAALCRFFGDGIQDRVQSVIKSQFHGELLVGQAVAVPTSDDRFPMLIYAPTMRVPDPITDSNAVFLACRAAFRAARDIALREVVMPGMGVGAGRVSPEVSAAEARRAFDAVDRGEIFPQSWRHAHAAHHSAHMIPFPG